MQIQTLMDETNEIKNVVNRSLKLKANFSQRYDIYNRKTCIRVCKKFNTILESLKITTFILPISFSIVISTLDRDHYLLHIIRHFILSEHEVTIESNIMQSIVNFLCWMTSQHSLLPLLNNNANLRNFPGFVKFSKSNRRKLYLLELNSLLLQSVERLQKGKIQN